MRSQGYQLSAEWVGVFGSILSRPGLPATLAWYFLKTMHPHTHSHGHTSYCHIQLATCVGSVLVAIVEQPSNCTCNWLPGSPKWFYVLWEVTCGNNSHSHSQTLATWHSPTHTHSHTQTKRRALVTFIVHRLVLSVCVCVHLRVSACLFVWLPLQHVVNYYKLKWFPSGNSNCGDSLQIDCKSTEINEHIRFHFHLWYCCCCCRLPCRVFWQYIHCS